MAHLTPFLMFPQQAEEAVEFYLSLFPGKILQTTSYTAQDMELLSFLPPEQRPGTAGQVKTIQLELMGQEYLIGNGGGHFKLAESAGFMVFCQDQAELDHYWQELVQGGEASQCGWVKDRFGLWWQVLPSQLGKWTQNPQQGGRVMAALLQMQKIEIAALELAAQG